MASSSIKAMAERAQLKAEEKFLAGDLVGARVQARKASILCSSLPGLNHMLAALDVLFSTATRKLSSGGGTDWFAVLGVDPSADLGSAKKRYMALCLLTHPDKNPSAAAGPAFKIVKQAWDAVSSSLALASSSSSLSSCCSGGVTQPVPSTQPANPGTRPQPAKAKKRAAPVEVDTDDGRDETYGRSRSTASSVRGKYACPRCHAEFS